MKPNFHLIERRIVSAESYFASKEVQSQLSREANEQKASLQPKNRHMFGVGLIGYIIGSSEKHILLKLSDFLVRKSMGSNAPLPFAEHGHFILEALGEVDDTKRADLAKHELSINGLRVVSGGGCSPR